MAKTENKYTLKEIITFMGKRKTKEIKHPKKYTLLEAKKFINDKQKEVKAGIRKKTANQYKAYSVVAYTKGAPYHLWLNPPARIDFGVASTNKKGEYKILEIRMDEYGKKHISVLASKLTLTEAKNWLSRKRGEIGKKGAFKFSKILSRSSEILTVEPELTHEFIFEKA